MKKKESNPILVSVISLSCLTLVVMFIISAIQGVEAEVPKTGGRVLTCTQEADDDVGTYISSINYYFSDDGSTLKYEISKVELILIDQYVQYMDDFREEFDEYCNDDLEKGAESCTVNIVNNTVTIEEHLDMSKVSTDISSYDYETIKKYREQNNYICE